MSNLYIQETEDDEDEEVDNSLVEYECACGLTYDASTIASRVRHAEAKYHQGYVARMRARLG